MNEAEYHALTAAVDRMLFRPGLGPARMANPGLHVVSEHEVHLAVHMDDAGGSEGDASASAASIGPGAGKGRFGRVRDLIRKYRADRRAVKETGLFNGLEPVDVILSSWLVSPDHLDKDDDFYFGPLQAHLAERGLSSLLVLGNLSGRPAAELLAKAVRKGPKARLLLPDSADPSTEIRLAGMLWGERRRLTALASDASDPLERQVAQRAARRGLWVPWLYNLRLHALTTQICRRVRPIAAVTLYEGHAREGLVWHAARLANPWCLAVGYQHTILRKNAHGVRRRPEGFPEFGPDWLWSMGDRGRDDLAACPGLREVPVRTYGTHRRPGGSALADEPQAEKTVLVLPEGLWNEAVTLFGFALRAARKNPEVRFILRCHPVLPFERLQDHLPDFDPDAANVEISRRPAIEDDFGRSGYLLYRGSSTVIYGILAGLRPLYLDQPGQMDLDPLYSLQGWRERIGTEAALSAVLDRDGRCSTEERRREWTKARDFCLAMARPVNPDAVDEMIEAARDRRRRLSGRFNQAG